MMNAAARRADLTPLGVVRLTRRQNALRIGSRW